MAQIFQVNGTNLTHITRGDWQEEPEGDYLNGKAIHNRWRRHILQANVTTAAEFDTLYALEGQKISLTTTNYFDRNSANYVTYYGAEVKRVSGQHEGPIMRDVQIECLVRI